MSEILINEKLARSLSAETTALLPYLPYLLQDLWELGSSPDDIAGLLAAHVSPDAATRVLDLGCGKGAVSVRLAKQFGCRVKGVDLLAEFIAEAQQKAEEHGVAHLCTFEAGDINRSVEAEKDYDVTILGALGDVLGSHEETLLKLKRTLKPGGVIVLDDAVGADDAIGADGLDGEAPSQEAWEEILRRAGVTSLEVKPVDFDELARMNRFNQAHIERRAAELAAQHPEKAALFEGYVRTQQEEIDVLENEIVGVTWLLQVPLAD